MAGPRVDPDTYGLLLLATLEGRAAQEIMERDDGLTYAGDPRDYFAPFRRWPAAERRAMRYVRGRVLDVGCGAGRVSLHLQERGHEVVAIDESPSAVEVATRRGVVRAERRTIAELDDSLGSFDTVVLLRNNFGLAGRGGRVSTLLRRLTSITTESGRIVTDSVDPSRLDEAAFRDYENPSEQRFRVRFGRLATPWFTYLMLSPTDFEELVAGSGWRVLRMLDEGSPRYAVVLEKIPAGTAVRVSR
jgi:SAM-dependent methyltransferase